MKAINKHGLTINGLSKAASETKQLDGGRSGAYVQIAYDTKTGDIYTEYHVCETDHTEWVDGVITVCGADEPMTMQQIADAIAHAATLTA